MRDYTELICDLKGYVSSYEQMFGEGESSVLMRNAADAIEELVRIGSKMHTWIFLHTTDEQAAYDEIGLTKEQNAMFGYSGQMILKADPPKEELNKNVE